MPWRAHLPPGSDPAAGDLAAGGSLSALWSERWSAAPAARLLYQVSPAGPDARRWVTAGELEERVARAASALGALGIGRGERVLWAPGPTVEAVVGHLGAMRAGAAVVPVNPGSSRRELAHVVADVRPVGALVDSPEVHRKFEGIAPRVLGPGSWSRAPAGTSLPGPPGARDTALVAYTSGTTGSPKGAVLSHSNVLANSAALASAWRWEAEDRLVHALPLFHVHGLGVALYTTLLTGASAVLLPAFGVESVLDAAADHRATMFFGVPTMYHRIAASGRVGELGRLRLAVSGSAPLAPALHARMAVEGVDVLERYGMTETGLTLSNPVDGPRRAGTVGFPLPGIEAELPEGGGELRVRGPQVFGGYFERPAATEESFEGGWFRTGDLAETDARYVRIKGRARDLVISGGFNVYPAEVEDVLLRHPGVAEVAVSGTPSHEWGEIVTAWVVPAGEAPDEDALSALAAGELADYKRPRLFRFVDSLPRNAMGKVQRGELR